jgi:glycosyltransferase involved in cell wall biosynthesis
MADDPRLSLLIPTRNEERWIGACVRAARAGLSATEIEGEILVCDGGSDDHTERRAERAGADTVLSIAEAHRPTQVARGARVARGDIFVLLHADALVTPGWLEAIVEAIDESGCVGGWSEIELLAERARFGSRHGLPVVEAGINGRTRAFRTATGDQGLFARRDVFERLGGLPDLPILEGWMWARRLRRAGPIAILDVPLRISGRRWEHGGLGRTTLIMYLVRAGFVLGIDPHRLARWWRHWTTRGDA